MADFPIREAMAAPTLGKRKDRADDDVKRRLGGPIHQERHVKIICVGAGASGLLFAYKMQRHFENFDLTIYEKNQEVSGTWYVSRAQTVGRSGLTAIRSTGGRTSTLDAPVMYRPTITLGRLNRS